MALRGETEEGAKLKIRAEHGVSARGYHFKLHEATALLFKEPKMKVA